MKKIVLLPVLFFAVLFIACNKDIDEELVSDSSFYALKNDATWISTSSHAYYSISNRDFTITGVKMDSVYYEEEVLYFTFNISDFEENNAVAQFTSKWYYIIGGDAISNSFVMDTTFQNQLIITSLDTDNKQISGTFQVKLMGDNRYSSQDETMLYKNGFFNITYTEVE